MQPELPNEMPPKPSAPLLDEIDASASERAEDAEWQVGAYEQFMRDYAPERWSPHAS
jgi:hypothetical protein